MKVLSALAFCLICELVSADWKPWSSGSTEPKKLGVLAGYTERHEEAYIGRATVDVQLVIGKLLVEGPFTGNYMPYGGIEHKAQTGVEYYAKDSQCNYRWIVSSNGEKVKNAIGYSTSPYTFYVGRTFESDSVQVGKVVLELNAMYYSYGGVEKIVKSYEVLICDTETT